MAFDLGREGLVLLDGAMGTQLQKRGLPAGAEPVLWGLDHPETLAAIHREYIQAGSGVIYANTFGANARKLARWGRTVEEVVGGAVAAARAAAAGTGTRVAVDIGPLGELLEPMGGLSFEAAYALFREIAVAGANAGADLAVVETMTDLYEAKAAVLAVRENTDLPVLVTMSFEEDGRTFTGCTVASMARTLEGLGADAVGLNCSLGPDRLAPLVAEVARNTRLPVIAKPNAGLPDPADGHYDMGPEAFAAAMRPCVEAGATLLGGCCGTSPAYIRALREAVADLAPAARVYEAASFVCTPARPCRIDGVRVIGERVNPTGKKRLQQALLAGDLDYVLELAVQQEDAGADLLDVNVGCPGVDEAATLPRVVKRVQSAVSLPLMLDSSDPAALEAGLRVYNGKAVVNSVNGDRETLERVLPIVRKYGAAVVGLCLDKDGIPETAEGRVAIARRILEAALTCGIPKEDVWIDCLTLTVSAQQDQAGETLRAVRTVTGELGLRTVLGVSNISFGLPNRPLITRNFLVQALGAGLSLPIVNPNQRETMDAVAAFRALSGEDRECAGYVARFAGWTPGGESPAGAGGEITLDEAILRGLREDAARLARQALETEEELAPPWTGWGRTTRRGGPFCPSSSARPRPPRRCSG